MRRGRAVLSMHRLSREEEGLNKKVVLLREPTEVEKLKWPKPPLDLKEFILVKF